MMPKHAPGDSCPSCEEKLKNSHEYLVDWFHCMKKLFPQLHISWSFRDAQSQEQAFKEGKSKFHFPYSAHNKMPSLALDLFALTEEGIAKFPLSLYAKIAQECEKAKDQIIWGGKFQSLQDFDHFQYQLRGLDG